MSVHDCYEDVAVWESIRHRVERDTAALLDALEEEIPNDELLQRHQKEKPIPHQLRRIMEQRADGWVQRVYGICCEARVLLPAYRHSRNVCLPSLPKSSAKLLDFGLASRSLCRWLMLSPR
ncbi:MAG: hypothetical protein DMG72_17870 [Acidobacteria bacterium]|nr:MAG: hypothetical protein DMG72_17870 [Acidobacteriota bacterium]